MISPEHNMYKISEIKPHLNEIAKKIMQIKGCIKVFAYGSLVQNMPNRNYKINDLDIIAQTSFNSEDFLSIDGGEDSPLKIASHELEDLGFNPETIAFTKQYLKIKDFNLDHWIATADNKILHWGIIPDNIDEWQEINKKAENFANKHTGYNRIKVANKQKNIQHQWYQAYTHSINQAIKIKKYSEGWFPSDHSATFILEKCIPLL